MDKIYRFLIDNANVRGEWVQLDAAWQALNERADYPAPVRHMLGEALAAVALLSATIKYKLCCRRLIRFVMAMTTVTNQVNKDIFAIL